MILGDTDMLKKWQALDNHSGLLIACCLYLPQECADDPNRRAHAHVPDDIVFQTKLQIGLDQLRAAHAAGIDAEFVLTNVGYGSDTDLPPAIQSSFDTHNSFLSSIRRGDLLCFEQS